MSSSTTKCWINKDRFRDLGSWGVRDIRDSRIPKGLTQGLCRGSRIFAEQRTETLYPKPATRRAKVRIDAKALDMRFSRSLLEATCNRDEPV